LATAPQPDRWSSGSDHVDTALLGPESIRTRLYEAGGNLDGVYYVRKSLLTQRRNREQALNDMLSRYALRADCCFLLSSSGKFSDVAASLGIRAVHLTRSRTLEAELDRMKADYEAASAG
jgi:rRNA-processing protein FCF1